MQPAGLVVSPAGYFLRGTSVIRGLDPKDMARRCREEAELAQDSFLADFLWQLADEYDEVARAQELPESP
jgi:hypothetical protein